MFAVECVLQNDDIDKARAIKTKMSTIEILHTTVMKYS